jgi:hypothetical protein
MGIKDLIPWNNGGREVGIHRGTDANPFFTLHREMNRMFDDVLRGFDLAPFGPTRALNGLGWPQIDIDETDKEVCITAELPGLDEKERQPRNRQWHSFDLWREKVGIGRQGSPFQRAVLWPIRTAHTAAGCR